MIPPTPFRDAKICSRFSSRSLVNLKYINNYVGHIKRVGGDRAIVILNLDAYAITLKYVDKVLSKIDNN